MVSPENIPVIVGVGEFIDRPSAPENALEPVALMAEAIQQANKDAGGDMLNRCASIEVVGLMSWRYQNPVGLLCDKLGVSPARQINASFGGETPIRLIHEAALRVVEGDQGSSIIVGGEAMNSLNKAMKSGTNLNWTPLASKEDTVKVSGDRIERSAIAKSLGVNDPATMYPLYEMALQAAEGKTPAQGTEESARLWAQYAEVAANNPYAWIKSAPSAEEIATVSPGNRMINWPYPKYMVANPAVNQSAAIIVTSLASARAAGVAEHNIVYLWGGGNAAEPDNFLFRDQYVTSPAMNATLDRAVEIAGGDAKRFSKVELYSCFPVVPKMALRQLQLDPREHCPTVAGGLTFFGGPLNNYMAHATCAMVRALRAAPGELGLLYSNGGFISKHHTMVISTQAPENGIAPGFSVQDEADRRRHTVPPLNESLSGPVTVETFTVMYERDGSPKQGVIVARNNKGERGMACVPATDNGTLAMLTSTEKSVIGMQGTITPDADGTPVWRPN